MDQSVMLSEERQKEQKDEFIRVRAKVKFDYVGVAKTSFEQLKFLRHVEAITGQEYLMYKKEKTKILTDIATNQLLTSQRNAAVEEEDSVDEESSEDGKITTLATVSSALPNMRNVQQRKITTGMPLLRINMDPLSDSLYENSVERGQLAENISDYTKPIYKAAILSDRTHEETHQRNTASSINDNMSSRYGKKPGVKLQTKFNTTQNS